MRQHVFFKTISLLLALALSAGLLAVPAAASGCEHLDTGTRSEQLSCTEMGATVTTCLDCGEELRRVYDQLPLGHLYTSSVTREATVDQTGVRTYTCTRCGDSYTEPIPKLDAPTGGTGGESSSLPDADLPDGQQPEGVLGLRCLLVPDQGAHADGELVDTHAAELRGGKVTELMDGDQYAENQNGCQDIHDDHGKTPVKL